MGEEEGEEEENSSVDATDGGGGGDGEKQHDAGADADDASDKKKESPSPAGAAAEASPSAANKDPSPDAVCYAWMATELLGSDLWHLMRAAKQRAKAEVASASASSSGATAAAAAAADETLQRRACKLACRALLAELAPAMLGALEQVHARGLVHRDVKLDNFAAAMASEGGEKGNKPSAFLLDFGGVAAAPSLAAGSAAVAHACKGKKTCFFGTPEYCSSTAFTGESPPTPAQDVEALGYCLLELWGGGRLPWGEAFRARRETETGRWSSSNLREMRLARDADWERAVRSGAVPWWLDSWITHAKQQQDVFAGALAAAVARASGGGAAAAAAEGAPCSASPPAAVAVAPGGGASPPGMPNYRLLRSLLKAAAAQASAEAEVAEEAAAKGRVVAASAHRFVKMEE